MRWRRRANIRQARRLWHWASACRTFRRGPLWPCLCGSRGGIRRLTAAVFLTLVAFSLPVELELTQLQPGRFLEQARAAAADGENMARDARAEIIIEAAEAYICTKAEAMGQTAFETGAPTQEQMEQVRAFFHDLPVK